MSPHEIKQRRKIAGIIKRRNKLPVGHYPQRDHAAKAIDAERARLEALRRYERRYLRRVVLAWACFLFVTFTGLLCAVVGAFVPMLAAVGLVVPSMAFVRWAHQEKRAAGRRLLAGEWTP